MLTPQEQVALGNGAFLSRGSPHGVKGLARMPLLTLEAGLQCLYSEPRQRLPFQNEHLSHFLYIQN